MTAGGDASCASDADLFETLFGWLGCATAWGLFTVPVAVVRKWRAAGDVKEFSCTPYLVSALQCSLWTLYALPFVTPCKLQPLVTNAVGGSLEICYCVAYVYFARKKRQVWPCVGPGVDPAPPR